jgi:3-deoxy-D-manno-octulosonic-acid transferase
MMLEVGGAVAVQNSSTMAAVLCSLIDQTDEHSRMATALKTLVSRELGAADRSFQIVQELMGNV